MNMKNFRHFFWFIALAGLIASCSRDEAAGPQNEASNRVRIGAGINEALQTRAASLTMPYNCQLRYVLEVWSTGTGAACIYRDEKVTTEADAVVFDFILSEAKDYKALLWADFLPDIERGSQVTTPNTYTHYEDYYYTTDSGNGLKAVALKYTGADYVINSDARDAFFACITIEKKTGAFEKDVELKRPFGQINVIEKNTDLRNYVKSMTLAYSVPDKFDVETGITTGTADVKPTVIGLPTATTARKANLFYDFIFAPAAGQTTLGEIALKFESNDAHVTLPDYKIPANMPVVRNKRTNISGSILTANSNDVTLTVSVSDGWTTPDNTENLDVAAARTILDACKTAGEGNDAKSYYYTITTAEQLTALSTLASEKITGTTEAQYRYANYVLDADIDLQNESWTPIDNFYGTFDGQGHVVRNMNVSIQSTATSTVKGGLFGYLDGTVSNLIVEGTVTVSGTDYCYAGGICGRFGGSIKFCRFNGTVTSTTTGNNAKNYAGGIIGATVGVPTITGCIANAKATISGGKADESGAGGLAGYITAQNISYSAWNNDYPDNGGTIAMVGKNADGSGDATATNSFTTIAGLNALLSGINGGVSDSDYKWVAGNSETDYPTLTTRK